SLLTRLAGGRYAMHDLVRAYAATQDVPDDVREAALRRVLDFYVHTAHAGERCLNPHRQPLRLDPPVAGGEPQPLADVPEVLAWFAAERVNLLAAQRTAAGHGWHHAVYQLAWTMFRFQHLRGHRHDRLAVWQAALDAATRLADRTLRMHA